MRKKTFILIESPKGSPRILGEYDLFLTVWPDTLNFITQHIEDLEDGEKAILSFTVHLWDYAELQAYLREHENIELDDSIDGLWGD